MVKSGNKGTYKHTGAESSKICDIVLYKNLPTSQNNSFANGQYSGTFLQCQNGGHLQKSFVKPSQRNLGLPSSEWDHDYCRVFTRNTQCGSRSSVTVSNGFQQMEAEPTYFQKDLQSLLDSVRRPLCLKNISSSTSIVSLENRSIQQTNACLSIILEWPR